MNLPTPVHPVGADSSAKTSAQATSPNLTPAAYSALSLPDTPINEPANTTPSRTRLVREDVSTGNITQPDTSWRPAAYSTLSLPDTPINEPANTSSPCRSGLVR